MTWLRHLVSVLCALWLVCGVVLTPVLAEGDPGALDPDAAEASTMLEADQTVVEEEPATDDDAADEEVPTEDAPPAPPPAPTPAPVRDAEPSTPRTGVVVRSIEFRGNRRITDDQILVVMRLRPGMDFSPSALQEDLRRINDMGVWASPPEFTPEALSGGVRLIILLEEMPPFSRAQVMIDKGEGLIPTGDLERAFTNNPDKPLVVGEVISNDAITAGIKALEGEYRSRGYVAAGVTRWEPITEGPDTGTIMLHVNEGVIKEIRIRGNRKTNNQVIWREITLKPGEIFNVKELNAVRRKLFALQLFDDVGVDFEFTDDQELILILKFVEARTGQLGFGVGYSSNDGLLGTLSYAERNFQGKGQSIRASGQIGGPEAEGSLSYFIPYFRNDGSSLGLELFRQSFTDTERDPNDRDRFASYDTRRTGGEVRYVYPVSRDIDASIGLKFLNGEITLNPESTADITDISEFAQRGLLDGSSHSLTLGLTRDTRDFPLDPASGSVTGIVANYFGGPLGGDFDAVKITGEFKRYWRLSGDEKVTSTSGPLERPHVFALRLQAGGTLGNLGLLDRYELGGTATIRGVEYATQTGDKQILANLEYRFPVVNDLSAAVFFDMGTAAQPGESLDFGNLLTTAGVGIRYRIPFLGVAPLRIDWGFDLGGDDSQVVLGFGQMF